MKRHASNHPKKENEKWGALYHFTGQKSAYCRYPTLLLLLLVEALLSLAACLPCCLESAGPLPTRLRLGSWPWRSVEENAVLLCVA
jgi:hypothetical protein